MSSKRFELHAFLSGADGRGSTKTYPKGAAIYCQGDEADSVFYLLGGNCKIATLSRRGKEAVIALPRRRDFFGEGCLLGQHLRIATVSTMTKATALKVSKTTRTGLLRDEPELSERFVSHLLARNARVEADLVDQLLNSSEKRLARLLLLMANFGQQGGTDPIIGRVSQDTLADMVGTTRSRVSFFMNRFRSLGFIEYGYNRALTVHSSLLNVILHESPEAWDGVGSEDKSD
jgi:CRP/FNR family transcriptional regulator, cyclic AMP receptor protein